jgi:FeS assembly SUF system protein
VGNPGIIGCHTSSHVELPTYSVSLTKRNIHTERVYLVRKMVQTEQILNALKNCYDPEIPVNIVDLGLIYDLKVENDSVYVKMTLTAPGCPAHTFLKEQVEQELLKVPGVKNAQVEIVWDPPWTPDRMSDAAREQLGWSATPVASLPMDMKPLKTGSEQQGEDGSIILVNPRGEAYAVSKHEHMIWTLCDGTRSVERVVEELANTLGAQPEQIRTQVVEIIDAMIRVGLLTNPDEFVQIDIA